MVVVFLVDGFEETEALVPVDILRRAGLTVQTVGVGGRSVTGSHGIPVTADIAEDELVLSEMETLVLPGGMPGTKNLENSAVVQAALDYAAVHECGIAAICAAPSVLGHKGLLRGRRATCFPGYETDLIGAVATGEPVTVDGPVITARGAGVSAEFAFQMVREWCSPQLAQKLKETMQCR